MPLACPAERSFIVVTYVSVEPAGHEGTEADDKPEKGRLEKPLPAESCR